jgi:hypothetical protein
MRLGSKDVIAIEADVVEHGCVRPVAHEALIRNRENQYRARPHRRYTSEGTYIASSSDFDRSIFDHDPRWGQRRGRFDIDLELEAQDGSALGMVLKFSTWCAATKKR